MATYPTTESTVTPSCLPFARIRVHAAAIVLVLLTSCSGGTSTDTAQIQAANLAATKAKPFKPTRVPGPIRNPILFVTQVPTYGDFSRLATFANHITRADSVVRGGDLMIRYPDGTLRNLTREAGFGMEGLQTDRAIAVREPTVHWNGTKAIFSMVVGGAPRKHEHPRTFWQLYEVTGLGKGQPVAITKVPNQPVDYNNVSPLYASDDRILFTSDRPRNGDRENMYPQLDEYESEPTIVGIYSLDPVTGRFAILNHTPSGAFTPIIDSFGRIIFTRWDHLQRDQQVTDADEPYNYSSEAPDAVKLPQQPEVFPEPREQSDGPYGRVSRHFGNVFSPWQMNQDGTEELTLNHIGRQEFAIGGFLPKTFLDDNALEESVTGAMFANRKTISDDAGIFHLREDPQAPGVYYGIYTHEFETLTTDQIVRITGAPQLNAEQMTIVDATPISSQGGRFRNPLPLTSGTMVATYTASRQVEDGMAMRLYQLAKNAAGMFVPLTPLTPGINKTLTWFSPDLELSYSGPLWEVEPVEVVARARPSSPLSAVEPAEKAVLNEELIDEGQLRAWLKSNNLALIVTRNHTSRDRGDRQQPFNLQVPGGTRTIGRPGRVYDIAHYQIFQANQVRGYDNGPAGRRVIAQPISGEQNVANAGGPPGSVKIAADGSTAAFVPANRALTWQTTDGNGTAIVRERMWLTLQAGEIRTCAACHGENSRNQAGLASPVNKPQALRELMRQWRQNAAPIRVNGTAAPNRVKRSQPVRTVRGNMRTHSR